MPSTPTEAKTLNLTALIERLEKADGPDRELDARIDAALRIGSEKMQADGSQDDFKWAWNNFQTWQHHPNNAGMCGVRHSSGDMGLIWDSSPFTASIDSAVALATRLLPNWTADADILNPPPMSDKYGVRLFNANGNWSNVEAQAATPALALVLATLRALEAKNA